MTDSDAKEESGWKPDAGSFGAEPDCTLLLRFLPTLEEGEIFHLHLNWTQITEELEGFGLSLDKRKSVNGSLFEPEWEERFYMSPKQARALHAWLGLMLSFITDGLIGR